MPNTVSEPIMPGRASRHSWNFAAPYRPHPLDIFDGLEDMGAALAR